jgi:hypothetical protein
MPSVWASATFPTARGSATYALHLEQELHTRYMLKSLKQRCSQSQNHMIHPVLALHTIKPKTAPRALWFELVLQPKSELDIASTSVPSAQTALCGLQLELRL